ncbi:MAG: DsbE family thiol:disulfide interchange protein [Proteobacteria bacterium]|nr:DsbE family thiol:disulfide interchange protein [Pseudomonadota bacterium]
MSLPTAPASRRLLLLAPLAVAGAGGVAFFVLLDRMSKGTYDPHGLPSMLIGKKLPAFDLPGLGQAPGISSAAIAAGGRPVLVNFFASWCVPCVEEAATLMALKGQGVPIYGIAYKDKEAATKSFLARNGDPYAAIGRDDPGRVAIDFGVYGVPETYVVDAQGIVRFRWAGALTQDVVQQSIMPLMKASS